MSLNSREDYLYENVSQIEITGSFLPSRQDNVIRGEDIARIREYAAETEAIMWYSNPFRNFESVHKIRDLSYLRTLWWDVQKASRSNYATSGDEYDYQEKWRKVSSQWNRVETMNNLSAIIPTLRIRTGNLVTPTANQALEKSATTYLISACDIRSAADNYFHFHGSGGRVVFDLTDETQRTQHKTENPDTSTSLPWGTRPACCMHSKRYVSGSLSWSYTASNIEVESDYAVSSVPTGCRLSRNSFDIVAVAVKSIGSYSVSAYNCGIFCYRGATNLSYDNKVSLDYQKLASLLNQVDEPSGSGTTREECVYITGIDNVIARIEPHSVR